MNAATKILLVDDDPAIRSSLQFSLELEGFDVDAFACAESVIDRPEPASAGCLILDYRLPGMDGLSLLDHLRERGIVAPAVLITSNPNRLLRRRADEAGVSLVEKPLLSDALTTTIRSLTGEAANGA